MLHYRRLSIYVSQQNGSFESWAIETEIIAAAYRYNIDMFVHKVINNEVQIMKFPMDDECNHNKQFMFVKNYNDHFDFVRTYVRSCRCLKSVVKILFEQNCITSNISSETVGVEI